MSQKNSALVFVFALLSAVSGGAQAATLVPPPYNLTDRHGVNMASGQVQLTHSDVKIGGELGLTHSISMHNNHWVGAETAGNILYAYGPADQYDGLLYLNLIRPNYPSYNIIVFDGSGTSTFYAGQLTTVVVGSSTEVRATPDATGCFSATTDLRSTLCFVSGQLVLTKGDGTRVYYDNTAGILRVSDRLNMVKIEKPNGLIINKTFHSVRKASSVFTNTGYQLKYYYIRDDRNLDSGGNNNDPDMSSSSAEWSALTPRYVKAINNSVEACSKDPAPTVNYTNYDLGSECSANNWPKVEYIWPAGMPRRMYLVNDTFSVINPDGTRTDYMHQPFEKASQANGGWTPTLPNMYKLPRLVAVKNATANKITMNYAYENKLNYVPVDSNFYYWSPGAFGVLKQSWIDGDSTGYTIGIQRTFNGVVGEIINGSAGYQVVSDVTLNPDTSAPLKFNAWNQSATFTGYENNRMKTFRDNMQLMSASLDPVTSYDARGNVISMTVRDGTQTAGYEASCNYSAAGNFKYCNSPNWTQDAKGNRTDYTYHQPSGQVATVKSPADKNGVRATTTFEYAQYAASYLDKNGNRVTDTPIWLKAAERSCIKNETCADGSTDQMLKRFDYDTKRNLNLIGVTVTAADTQGQLKTKRTCYRYDIYSNVIAETQAKAGVSSCSY